MSTSASVSPPTSTTRDAVATSKAHGTPIPPSVKSSPLSTWFSPSQSADRSKQSTNASDVKSTPEAEKSSSSAFGSTWGGGDSFWGSYFGSPSTSDQGVKGGGGGGGGEGQANCESVKEAPRPTSMSRGTGTRKMKSSASPAVKSESDGKRKTVTSPSISSPPKASSTPLTQVRAKSGATTDSSSTSASSKPVTRPEHSSTPKTSLKAQPKKASLRANKESAEASTSEGSTKVKPEKLPGHGSRASPMPTTLIRDTGVESTDDGSTGTGKIDSAVPKVEEKALTQPQLAGSSRKTNADSGSPETREHSNTDCGNSELTNKSSHDFQSSPTPHQGTALDSTAQTQTCTSSKGENKRQTHSHSPPPTHPDSTQRDSTKTKTELVTLQQDIVNKEDCKQTTSVAEEKSLSNAELESTSTNTDPISEAKSDSKKEKQVRHTSSSELPELRCRENEEKEGDQSAKVTDEKDAALHQIQMPITGTNSGEQQRSTPGAPISVAAEAAEGEGHGFINVAALEEVERQSTDNERKVEAGSSKEERSEEGHSNPDIDKLKKVSGVIQ